MLEEVDISVTIFDEIFSFSPKFYNAWGLKEPDLIFMAGKVISRNALVFFNFKKSEI